MKVSATFKAQRPTLSLTTPAISCSEQITEKKRACRSFRLAAAGLLMTNRIHRFGMYGDEEDRKTLTAVQINHLCAAALSHAGTCKAQLAPPSRARHQDLGFQIRGEGAKDFSPVRFAIKGFDSSQVHRLRRRS